MAVSAIKNIELLYYHDMGINIMIILIGFILLLWIQVKRFTHFAKSGGLTRIQVLPVSKRSFIFGEVLFNYASVLLLASVPFLVWFMMIALQPFHFPFMNNLYAMQLCSSPLPIGCQSMLLNVVVCCLFY